MVEHEVAELVGVSEGDLIERARVGAEIIDVEDGLFGVVCAQIRRFQLGMESDQGLGAGPGGTAGASPSTEGVCDCVRR